MNGFSPGYTEVQRLWRNRAAVRHDRSVSVVLGGNCGMDFCVTGLLWALDQRGIGCTIVSSDFGNWVGSALDGSGGDFWVVWLSSLAATGGEIDRPPYDVEGIASAVRAVTARGATVIVVMPEPLAIEDDPFSPFAAWRRGFVDAIDRALPQEAIRLRIDHLLRKLGDRRWFAPRYWTLAKSPAHPDGATAVGIEAGKAIAQCIRPAVKAVVVDLDNTLWGGVVGDDGADGLQLDRFGEGRAFLAMQRFLLDVKAQGIPLAVVSKNEPANARAPFVERSEMLLTLEDFVYFHASWDHKYLAIDAVIRDLNVGRDTVCFLDDSPQERAEAAAFLPGLLIPDLPVDPEARVVGLQESGMFSFPLLRRDDIARAARYTEERSRQAALVAAPSFESYLDGLVMVLEPAAIQSANLPRVASLVQKTNQFNVSGRRHTAPQLLVMADGEAAYAYCFSLRDRFGEAGIISAVLGAVVGGDFVLDTWVLSCRVFGRLVEHAILGHLAEWCRARGVDNIVVKYVSSGKNQLVVDFLLGQGFTAADADTRAFVAPCASLTPRHRLTIAGGAPFLSSMSSPE